MFLDFIYHLMFLKNTTFRKLDLFPSSGKIMGATTLLDPLETASLNHYQSLLALSNGPNRISAPFILSEVGNISSFRNVVFTETDDGQSPKTRFLEIMYFVTS
jgi:hypothetical protein